MRKRLCPQLDSRLLSPDGVEVGVLEQVTSARPLETRSNAHRDELCQLSCGHLSQASRQNSLHQREQLILREVRVKTPGYRKEDCEANTAGQQALQR